MALWGNNDNVGSEGTVSLALSGSDWTITGSGTTFGNVGAAQTGDVIRIGLRGGGGTYYGDAAVVGIASTTQLTIGSTAGLSDFGASIASTSFYVSELPVYTVDQSRWSNTHDNVATRKVYKTAEAADMTALGGDDIAITNAADLGLIANSDTAYVNSVNILVTGIGTALATADVTAGVGTNVLYVVAPPGVAPSDSVDVQVGGIAVSDPITSIGATTVSIASTISAAVSASDVVTFNSANVISLGSTVSAGINTGDTVTFRRLMGGYDRNIFGISTTQAQAYDGVEDAYRTSGSGWVGVTTYTDMHGNLRVKQEILVAMSGITTGADGIIYPSEND